MGQHSILSLLAVLLLPCLPCPAATITVPDDHPTIQTAINAATDGDTVLVRAGTWSGDGNRDLDFGGKNVTLSSESGPERTIIECGGSFDETHRGIHFNSGEGPETVVSGFTITGGFAWEGGAILCDGASTPTITGCIITGNDAEFRGGGITLLHDCNAVIDNNLITGNRVVSSSGWGNSGGGGLSAEFCSPTISNNRFIGNSCGARGGGMHGLDLEYPVLHNNLVAGNSAAMNGGGWSLSGESDITVSQCTFAGNTTLQQGQGLSYHYSYDSLLVENCIFWGNGAPGDPQLHAGSATTITYTSLQGGESGIEGFGTVIWGAGAHDEDPLFVRGPLGDCFLSQTAAGQPEDSFCVDRGNPAGPVTAGTTRTDLAADTGWPDMGYHYTVPPRDLLQVDPMVMVFAVEAGAGNPPPQELDIWNGGPGTLDWSVSNDAEWLALDPLDGESVTGEIDTVTVCVETGSLSHGTYSGSILIGAPGSLGAPLSIPVELRITETYTVDSGGGGDFSTIRDALDAALPGDTLLLAPGTYTGTQNRDLDIVTGGITLSSTQGAHKTVIDCQGKGRGFMINVDDPYNPVTLSGITIAHGQSEAGGAIHCSGETILTLDDVRIHSSQAAVEGGGLLCTGLSAVQLGFGHITGNSAGELGGGICVSGFATLVVEDSTISHNLCDSGVGGLASGGGLAGSDSAALVVRRCAIEHNEAYDWGGGIFNNGDDRFLVEDSTLRWNRAGFSGGAIYGRSYVEALISSNIIEGNEASWGGGIYTVGRVVNNLIIGNVATNSGGGLTTEGFTSPRVESCTFFNNSAANRGGAIECWDVNTVSLRNCILWNNQAPSGREVFADGDGTIRIDFCDVDTSGDWSGGAGDTQWGEGNLETAPLFAQGPLGTFYLSQQSAGQPETSSCVDAGDPLSDVMEGTTRTDGLQDEGILDLGFHYPATSGPYICSQPGQFVFGTTPGEPPPDQPLDVWRCGTGTLEWEVTSDQAWVLLSPASGTSSGEVDPIMVGIDPAGLGMGEYQATITIAATGDAPVVLVPLLLTIGEPLIEFSPDSFNHSVMVYENPPPVVVLEIWQGGSGILYWSVDEDVPWLSLSPLSGSSIGEHDPVELMVDHTGLPHGLYDTVITIESPNALNSPQEVPVQLRVDEFIIHTYPIAFAFVAQAGGPPPPDEWLRIRNNGAGTMAWELNCDAEWLHFDTASGKVGDGASTVWIGTDSTLLEPGQYQADLILSAEGAANTPLTIPVHLTVELDGLVTGPGPAQGNQPLVRIFPPVDDTEPLLEFPAYGATQFGVNVSVGDLDRDGFDEIITGAGPGEIYGPHVRGFEVDGTPLPGLSFLAYSTNRYGVNVTAGELDGDGYDEIVTGAGPGAVFGPHIRGWNYDGTPEVSPMPGVSFMAYSTPKWGVNVAAGDIDGDGYDEIVTGPGPGAVYGPHVRGWNVDGGPATAIPSVSFLAYGTSQYGVNVSAGDVDGDGIDEIVTGAGPGAVFGPHVRGWNYDGASVTPLTGYSFFAWQTLPLTHGVNVFAEADLNGNGRDELVTGRGPAPSADTEVKVFTYDGSAVQQWFSLEAYPGFSMGTNVAAGRF